MPARIGSGRRKRAASANAKSCVLSPISLAATRTNELAITASGLPFALFKSAARSGTRRLSHLVERIAVFFWLCVSSHVLLFVMLLAHAEPTDAHHASSS